MLVDDLREIGVKHGDFFGKQNGNLSEGCCISMSGCIASNSSDLEAGNLLRKGTAGTYNVRRKCNVFE